MNCGARSEITQTKKFLSRAELRAESGNLAGVRNNIAAARRSLDAVIERVDDFERVAELIAVVYAMRYRDKMTIPGVVMALREYPSDFWRTAKQVEEILRKDIKSQRVRKLIYN